MANKETKKLTFEEKCGIAITAAAIGGTGALVGAYAFFLHKQKVKYDETMDKFVEQNDVARKCDAYLNSFLNYICGKSEKVRDVLLEEGILKGDGWGLPIGEEDLTE